MVQQLLWLKAEVLLHAAVLYVVFSFALDFKIEQPVLGSSWTMNKIVVNGLGFFWHPVLLNLLNLLLKGD